MLLWIAPASAPSRSMSACLASFCSRSRRPSSLRASRSASSLAWPIDLLTSLAWRESSSTSACRLRRCGFELDEPRDVGLHAAAVAVLLDDVGIFENEAPVEHGREEMSGSQSVRCQAKCRF